MPRSPPAEVNGSEHLPVEGDAGRSQLEGFSPTVICGLQNIGNTCYFNSGLQVLANVGAFISALRYGTPFSSEASTKAHAETHPFHTTARFRLFLQTRALFDQMTSGGTLCVAPTDLVHQFASVHSSFEGLQQQDTTEMLTGLLSEIEDLTKVPVAVPEALQELATASGAPVHPSSRSFLQMLKVRDEVNQANALEETREQHAKGNLTFHPTDYVPPTMTTNTAVDCFRGHMLHRIVCSECQYVSRTVEEFTSLAVDIPLKRQRTQFERSRPHVNRYDAEGTLLNPAADGGDHNNDKSNSDSSGSSSRPPTAGASAAVASGRSAPSWSWWNPLHLVACVWSFLWSCCVGEEQVAYSLTLEECLDMYFADEHLTGTNLYHCPKCRKKTAATKSHQLLWCPEYLVVHLKRFQVGTYWTYKRHDSVIFPLGSDVEGSKKRRPLDMRPFSTAVDSSVATGSDGGAAAAYLGSQQYQLTGVVNHHGSFGGGHYTAFAYKGPSMGWVLTNDASISRATEEDVAESQEYLLVYRKLPLRMSGGGNHCGSSSNASTASSSLAAAAAAVAPEHALWQDKARRYLLTDGASRSSGDGTKCNSVLVSRSWLHRVATFSEPGPLLNRLCYSGAGDSRRSLVSPVGHYVNIDKIDFQGLVAYFGGSPTPPS